MNIETSAKLSETHGTVEELCTWHTKKRGRDRCASSYSVNTASRSGDCLKELTGRADESGWYAHLSGLNCVGARAWERIGLVGRDELAELTHSIG